MTSTAALQAAIEVSGSQDPAVGYSVAYPIGVIGPILCMYLFRALLRPKVEALLLGWSAAILLAVVLTTLLVGHVLKIAYDELLGIASGVTGNPAILAYASRAVPTDRPDIGYALIFPGATLVKIVVVNVLTALFLR